MKLTKDMLLAGFAVSLLVAIASLGLHVAAYVSLGSPLERGRNGCALQVLIEENDRYIIVCPEDTMYGKVAAFLAPKAAVASILLFALFMYQLSRDARKKQRHVY